MTAVDLLPIPDPWPRILLPAGPSGKPAPNPLDLDAAVAAGAFSGLTRAVREMSAGEIVAILARSGLRGRGGAGFPTSEKWRTCALTPADARYVVVHAYQADPAVMIERVLLERNPYAVLEGAAIAAVAVDASEIVVAVRAEAEETVAALSRAIDAATAAGYLGDDVLGTGRAINARVQPLSGAYMIGEETVLLKAIEGLRGQPEQEPPYPATKGLYGKPTLVHNPQTLAVVPTVVRGEGKGFARDGSWQGSILVQVSGAVARPGLAEVPLGATLGDILNLAGGVPGRHGLKAVLVGGPSGGILPPEALSTPYQFEALEAAGAHMGSGSIVAVDERTCLVDLAAVLTRFCADVACGKTIPCRIGLRRIAEIGARITEGVPRGDDLTRLADLSADVVASRLCDHESRSTLPMLSLVRYFRDELDDHMLRSHCATGTCQMRAVPRSRRSPEASHA